MQTIKLSSRDITDRCYHELSAIAASYGIDWDKVKDRLSFDGTPIKRGIELGKRYRGAVFVVAHEWTAPDGNTYPTITFKTFKHGDIKETWNGFRAWRDLSDNTYIPKAYAPKKPSPILSKDEQERLYKINRFSAFKKDFGQLPQVADTGEIGAYLTRKGFTLPDLPIGLDLRRGEDNRGWFVVYPLQNGQQSIVGFQKIYDKPFTDSDGKRRDKDFIFYPDSKNGSNAWLGTPSGQNGTVRLVEGLATGLTVHMATGQPVVVCLDAGNLGHVHSALAKNHESLIICADNDIRPNNEGNVGLFKAIQAARFSDTPVAYPELGGKKCDFNDLHLALGIDAVRTQLGGNVLAIPKNALDYYKLLAVHAPKQQLPKIISTLCFYAAKTIFTPKGFRQQVRAICGLRHSPIKDVSKSLKKEIKKRVNSVIHDNTPTDFSGIDRHDFEGMDNGQMADEIITQGGIWIDYRGMGAGKTKLMGEVATRHGINGRAAYIAHRVSLTKTASGRLEFHHYQDGNSGIENMAVCVDSIIRRDLFSVKVLFIDEARQVLEHVLDGRTVKNRLEVYNRLIGLIQAADLVILADADLNQFTVDWIKSIANKPIHAIDTYQAKTGKTIHALGKNSEAIYQAQQAILEGQNVWIATDSTTQATKMKIALMDVLDDNDVLFLTQKNKGDERQAAFLLDPNKESAKYRAIIHTPVISSGVSIENDHFHAVYALFCNVIPPNEMLQTIARVRAVKDVYVSCKANHVKNRLVKEQELIEGEMSKRGRYCSDTGTFQLIEFDRLRLKQIVMRNRALNDHKGYFLILAQIKGYAIEQTSQESQTLRGLGSAAKSYNIAEVLSGETIDDSTAKAISTKPNPTQTESNALDKHNTAQITGKNSDTVNAVDVEFYLNGGGKIIANHELIDADIPNLQERDRKNHDTRDRIESLTGKHLFFSLVISLMGKQIDKEMAGRIDGWLCENYKELASNGMGNYAKPSTRPFRRLSNFLKLCGYELALYKQKADGQRIYEIKANAQVAEYVQNRSHKRGLFA